MTNTTQFASPADMPLHNRDFAAPKFRPIKAFRHFRNLIADKEDTAEVFHIIEALAGKAFVRNAKDFLKSPHAQELMERNVDLPAMLDNHDKLRELPADSLGQAYVRFMEREGLTAAGLVAESESLGTDNRKRNDITEWFGNRMRDTHDLLHVLTGYGRDALGEQCVLGFTYSQNPNLGILFIAYAGALEMKKQSPSNAPVLRAVREGQRLGKAAKRLAYYDIEKILAMPIGEARAFLNIGKPTYYQQAHRAYEAQGIDPYNLLGQPA
ncbi:Coq4 family protein [Parasphingorhabdus sp. JC815]|uniref:Coq4 family protein n=1 Tax=Parasphingorhabdus sp. JC815 TaxID=3232140 RepID=UPI003458A544